MLNFLHALWISGIPTYHRFRLIEALRIILDKNFYLLGFGRQIMFLYQMRENQPKLDAFLATCLLYTSRCV